MARLELLAATDKLMVYQEAELSEVFCDFIGCCFEAENKYRVHSGTGQQIYFAEEDTSYCNRCCCGKRRPFEIQIYDNNMNEVIRLERMLRCQSCWFPCCLQKLEVSAPPGNIVGWVEQSWTICQPCFVVKDGDGDVVLRIQGPCCTSSCFCCSDASFRVMSADGYTEIGKIAKKWTGIIKEYFTDADNFGISFPVELAVETKAVLLGACFLIDYMFFENTPNSEGSTFGLF